MQNPLQIFHHDPSNTTALFIDRVFIEFPEPRSFPCFMNGSTVLLSIYRSIKCFNVNDFDFHPVVWFLVYSYHGISCIIDVCTQLLCPLDKFFLLWFLTFFFSLPPISLPNYLIRLFIRFLIQLVIIRSTRGWIIILKPSYEYFSILFICISIALLWNKNSRNVRANIYFDWSIRALRLIDNRSIIKVCVHS